MQRTYNLYNRQSRRWTKRLDDHYFRIPTCCAAEVELDFAIRFFVLLCLDRPMPTLTTASLPVSAPECVVGKKDSIETRSETIARLAARMAEIPNDVVRQVLTPHTSRQPHGAHDPLVSLIEELLNASKTNEPMAVKVSVERDLAIGCGLAVSLRWLYRVESVLGTPQTLRIILKALMPLYLAAGQGKAGTGIVDTFSLVRSSCMILELDRLTSDNELAEWLVESNRLTLDPYESISKSFGIALPNMANVFWREIAAKSSDIENSSTRLSDLTNLTAEKHSAWWMLAGQLCSQRAQITIPATLSVGVIAWEKLLDHWQRVSRSLAQEVGHDKSKAIGPIGSSSGVEKSVAPLVERSLNLHDSATTKSNQKSKLTNDHRFVEIRSSRDPQLSSNLDQMLQQIRNEQGTLSLIVVKKLGANVSASTIALQNWQSSFIEYMDTHGEATNVRGFLSDDGELTLVFQDVDRAELTQWIRESFAKFNDANDDSTLATAAAQPLVAGVAMVSAPSRSFKIDQLIQAALRCLDGASTQGAGAVKTIEVY